MFGAALVNRGQVSGQPQAWLDMSGTLLIIRARRATDQLVQGKNTRIDHFGLRVDDPEKAAAGLKAKGAKVTVEPTALNPTTKIAFIEGPAAGVSSPWSAPAARAPSPPPRLPTSGLGVCFRSWAQASTSLIYSNNQDI